MICEVQYNVMMLIFVVCMHYRCNVDELVQMNDSGSVTVTVNRVDKGTTGVSGIRYL